MVEKTKYIPSFYDQIPVGGVEHIPTGADGEVFFAELMDALEDIHNKNPKDDNTKQILELNEVVEEIT